MNFLCVLLALVSVGSSFGLSSISFIAEKKTVDSRLDSTSSTDLLARLIEMEVSNQEVNSLVELDELLPDSLIYLHVSYTYP